MGWRERQRIAARARAEDARAAVSDLRVAVDVQHLYRRGRHAGDRGARFGLASGSHVWETDATVAYAASLAARLRFYGVTVLTNDPLHGIMVGDYVTRNRSAAAFGVNAYLACHVNAGHGSYSLTETGPAGAGGALGDEVGRRLTDAWPVLLGARTGTLHPGERGWVCIGALPASVAGLILEPFFGDTLSHQSLFRAAELQRLGMEIANAVCLWWRRSRLVGTPA